MKGNAKDYVSRSSSCLRMPRMMHRSVISRGGGKMPYGRESSWSGARWKSGEFSLRTYSCEHSQTFPLSTSLRRSAGVEFLNVLRGEKELDWTFLSPSYFFAPGESTGKFRLGKDELLVAADGQSRISTEDFAIALVDELEQPKHSRQRFTVGY